MNDDTDDETISDAPVEPEHYGHRGFPIAGDPPPQSWHQQRPKPPPQTPPGPRPDRGT
jgi:hypothetical protein